MGFYRKRQRNVWQSQLQLYLVVDWIRYGTPIIRAQIIDAIFIQNVATALVFFLLMLQHPDAQHKARAEIDAVVGFDRLPTISDRASLPYVRSLFTEVLRLYPVAPLGNLQYSLWY